QTSLLQDLEMLRHRRAADRHAAGDRADRLRPGSEPLEHVPTRRIGQRRQGYIVSHSLPEAKTYQKSSQDQLWPGGFAPPCPGRMASAPRVAQPVMRRSTAAQTRYMPMPMTLGTRRPAKASGTSKRDDATSIRWPMPLLAATVSATIVPTKANVIATFSEAK